MGRHLVLDHGESSSMVIRDFHVQRIAPVPTETNPPSIVDADAPLAGAIPLERLQGILAPG
jgi:hypothetical protein